MSSIDPRIVEQNIKMYKNVIFFWQKLQPVDLIKATTIKAKVEKLLKASFIYIVPLTKWVSNLFLVDKK
jgi:hypothetical protein